VIAARVRKAGAALALVVVLGLVLAACGAETPDAAGTTTASPSAVPSDMDDSAPGDGAGQTTGEKAGQKGTEQEVDTSNSVLPSVQVKDVAGGEVDLAGLVPSERPILLWAWAPHCPICASEAPGVEAFAKANGDKVTVIGLGTQDDLSLAEEFVATYGVDTPQMLWDPGFDSWQALEITGQPTWVLLSPGGEELGRWQGSLPVEAVLAKV
jgi:thiol-disulfide isomerase/thioredoxin